MIVSKLDKPVILINEGDRPDAWRTRPTLKPSMQGDTLDTSLRSWPIGEVCARELCILARLLQPLPQARLRLPCSLHPLPPRPPTFYPQPPHLLTTPIPPSTLSLWKHSLWRPLARLHQPGTNTATGYAEPPGTPLDACPRARAYSIGWTLLHAGPTPLAVPRTRSARP